MRTQEYDKSPAAGDNWGKLKLDPKQAQVWEQRRTIMLWTVPSFSDIWFAMMIDKDGRHAWFTDQIPTMATDDKFLYINPAFYFGLTDDEATFGNAHEIMHAMYGHAGLFWSLNNIGHIDYMDGVRLPWINELGQYAADYIINDQLIEAKIGAMPAGGLHWPALITGDMAFMDAYRKLYDEMPKPPKPRKSKGNPEGDLGGDDKEGKSNKGGGGTVPDALKRTTCHGADQGAGSGKPFDSTLKPGQGRGKTPTQAVGERKQIEWDTAIQAAMESAKLRGQLPANLERMFTKRLEPQADWRDLYQLAVCRRLGNDRYTWETLQQQLAFRRIGAPGRKAHGCELVVIARDTSGSITPRTIEVFAAETRGIMEQVNPKRIILVDCDASVNRWDELDDASQLEDPEYLKMKGGGGTMFEPVFERLRLDGEEPDMVIYLTDGYGSFPERPSYPVIWGSITDNKGMYPWGEVVFVPQQVTPEGY